LEQVVLNYPHPRAPDNRQHSVFGKFVAISCLMLEATPPAGFVPRNSAIENVKKNPILWQKNFEFVGEFEASSEMRSL
jgi:hypothetical protein